MIKELSYKLNRTWDASVIDPIDILDSLIKEI
jgi:hypothetical protein